MNIFLQVRFFKALIPQSSEDDYANGGHFFQSGEFKGNNVDDDGFPPSEDFQGTDENDEDFPPSEYFQGTNEDDEESPPSGYFKSSEDDYVDGGQFFPGGQFKGDRKQGKIIMKKTKKDQETRRWK